MRDPKKNFAGRNRDRKRSDRAKARTIERKQIRKMKYRRYELTAF